jgi:glyoxylase-like metal-dependent hydrolase (beta-lactamase superfamily II)
MQVVPLSEGAFTVDKTKLFVPFDPAKDDLQARPFGSLLVEVQPFAIVTREDVLVLDGGLGFERQGMLQLHQNLQNAGILPDQVTKVLVSHLHKDHSGGLGREERPGGPRVLSFPQARYYIQQKELTFAFDKGFPSYLTEELECLRDAPQVELLDGNGVIDGYIRYELTGAHCPYHQAFWIVEGGETFFFGGDVAPQWQQMKNRFLAKYDFDGKKSMELRKAWWEKGRKEHWTFLFYHDILNPVVRPDA